VKRNGFLEAVVFYVLAAGVFLYGFLYPEDGLSKTRVVRVVFGITAGILFFIGMMVCVKKIVGYMMVRIGMLEMVMVLLLGIELCLVGLFYSGEGVWIENLLRVVSGIAAGECFVLCGMRFMWET